MLSSAILSIKIGTANINKILRFIWNVLIILFFYLNLQFSTKILFNKNTAYYFIF